MHARTCESSPVPRLLHTLDGTPLRVEPGRLRALAALSGKPGIDIHLGVRLSPCRRCGEHRVGSRVTRWLRRSRRVGRLVGRRNQYDVLVPEGSPGVRILARLGADGRYALLSVQLAAPSAAPPTYLAELDLAELEAETQLLPLDARVAWSRSTLTPKQLEQRGQRNKREHVVYIALDKAGKPLKVGESMDMSARYTAADRKRMGIESFHVGRVLDAHGKPLMGPFVRDVERLVSRKLARMGVPLPEHDKPNPAEPIVTKRGQKIELARAIPAGVRRDQAANLRKLPNSPERRSQLAQTRKAGIVVNGRSQFELTHGEL